MVGKLPTLFLSCNETSLGLMGFANLADLGWQPQTYCAAKRLLTLLTLLTY